MCDLTEPVGLSQPTVSHHLKILVDAGVLQREQRGKWAYYRLVPETLTSISGSSPHPVRVAGSRTVGTLADRERALRCCHSTHL